MRYMMLVYTQETEMEKASPEEMAKVFAGHVAVQQETQRRGIFRAADPLKYSVGIGVPNGNCSTRANSALDAAGIPMVDTVGNPLIFPWQTPAPRGLPGTAGHRGRRSWRCPLLNSPGEPATAFESKPVRSALRGQN
jgi:hypothetical protein